MEKNHQAVVVGGGNAALSAAVTLQELGIKVVLLEAAPEADRGGNSQFVGGGTRYVHQGKDDIVDLLPEMADPAGEVDVAPYTSDDFFDDIGRNTDYLADPDSTEILVKQSRDAVRWWHDHGVRFSWSFGRHAHRFNGRFRFPPGISTNITGGGAGLVETLYERAADAGVDIRYNSSLSGLSQDDDGAVNGVIYSTPSARAEFQPAGAVVLACGGFESNPAMRAQFLGPRWDIARVRGTRHNMGGGLRAALSIGAEPYGNWSGCHAVASDANTPLYGNREVADLFARHSYPFGIVVNRLGKRFIDEGADFQPNTYAKYGAAVLSQPESLAYQIFDSIGDQYVRAEYRHPWTTVTRADTISDLATELDIDAGALQETVETFNSSAGNPEGFDPNALDGVRTRGLSPEKSNWALPIRKPPFAAYPVTAAITFTFGGLHVDSSGAVLAVSGRPIPGLYAAGEIVGGLFYHNYSSGTGLVAGTVFGRLAAQSIAAQG